MQVTQLFVSFKRRKEYADQTGDPWNGRTLEWATSSPPPFYNFAVIPKVTSAEPFWEKKQQKSLKKEELHDIELPKNTGMGIYISIFAFFGGFALIWHIHWLFILGAFGSIICLIIRSFDEETEYKLTVKEIEKYER